jgi:hypothetical protein
MRVLVGGAASLAEAGTAPTSVDAMTIPTKAMYFMGVLFRSHDRDMTQYPGPKIVPLV